MRIPDDGTSDEETRLGIGDLDLTIWTHIDDLLVLAGDNLFS